MGIAAHSDETSPSGATSPAWRVVAGRECGTCTLCCKVAGVEELSKPIGVWCPHCVKGKRCTIYDQRPPSCRLFHCQWLVEHGLGPEWKPERAKFALVKSDGGRRITALVDPGFPSAWRGASYYPHFKRWATLAAAVGKPGSTSAVMRRPPSDFTSANFARSGFHSGPSRATAPGAAEAARSARAGTSASREPRSTPTFSFPITSRGCSSRSE